MTDEAESGDELARMVATDVTEQGTAVVRIVDGAGAVEATADGTFTYALDREGTRIASMDRTTG